MPVKRPKRHTQKIIYGAWSRTIFRERTWRKALSDLPLPGRSLDPALVKKKLQEGCSVQALLNELHVSEIYVKKLMKENGLEKYLADRQTRARRAKGLKDLRQYHDYIKKSLEDGLTIWQIAKELDVDFKSIRTYVKIWKLWHLHKPIGPPQPNKKFRFE